MRMTLLLQLLSLIDESRKRSELIAELERVLDCYGFEFYGVVRFARQTDEAWSPILAAHWPAGWSDIYMQRRYMVIDPAVRYLGYARKGFRWQEAIAAFSADPHRKRTERMMTEARLHGLRDGYVFPVHGRTGLQGFLSLGGNRSINLNTIEMTLFDGLAKKIFWKLISLIEDEIPTVRAEPPGKADLQMTRREMEVLHHLAEGMTSNEISRRLGLSPHTIDWYMNGLQDKLRARNRHHAIAVAFRLGLVS